MPECPLRFISKALESLSAARHRLLWRARLPAGMTSTGFLMVAPSSGLSGGGREPHFGIVCPPTHPSAKPECQHPQQATVNLGTGADAPVCPRPVGPTRLALLLGAIEAIAALRLSEPGLSQSQRNTVISIHSYASWYSARGWLAYPLSFR